MSADSTCQESLAIYYKKNSYLKCVTCADGMFMHLNKCVSACPTGYVSNSANSCFCANSSLITIYDQCLPLVTCPISMGWDPLSNSCFSCRFGCLTCYNSACTSCSPGYFLYISPQGVRCRRKSPLYPCDQQYGWVQSVCLVIQYSDPNLGLTQCYASVPNCKACSPGRSDICILCNPGYYIHNNTCITTCPNGTEPYNSQVCILQELNKCKSPYLAVKGQEFVLNYDLVANSAPYQFYTFAGKESPNDPVGYIPVYQQMIDRKNDGQFRNSEFYHPLWTCLLCNDGYGLSSDFASCLPCPANCLTCYMAQNNSCITTKSTTPSSGCYYIDKATNNCLQSCSSSTSQPQVINGLLYCVQTDSNNAQNYARIDSAVYVAADGSKNVFFVIDQTVKSSSPINLNVLK